MSGVQTVRGHEQASFRFERPAAFLSCVLRSFVVTVGAGLGVGFAQEEDMLTVSGDADAEYSAQFNEIHEEAVTLALSEEFAAEPGVYAARETDAEAAAATQLIWQGSGATIWQDGGEAGASPWVDNAVFENGNSVLFDDSGQAGEVILEGAVAPGAMMVNANNAGGVSGTGSAELEYGYAFTGTGSITDYTDSNGNVHKTSITNEGTALLVLDTRNTFSGGITLAEGSSLYLSRAQAAGTGMITLNNDTTLLVNYRSTDVDFRTPTLTNALSVNGNVKISPGIGTYGEDRVPANWRTLTLSGGVSGSGELSLYGYTYLTKPTQFEDREIIYNYVSSIAINERNAVVEPGTTPERFTGTVYLKNEFNERSAGNHEGVIAERKFLGGAIQMVLVDDVFSQANLNLTRHDPEIRTAGHNQYGGARGDGQTSDNILVLSDSPRITIKSLDADFRGTGWEYTWEGSKQNNYKLKTTFVSDYAQEDERWLVRVVTDGITNLVLADNTTDTHVFSGSMGYAHSYTQPTQGYIEVGNPSLAGGGSLGVEMLSLEKRGLATQYIHSANLVNLSVVEGVLGFNHLSVKGTLNLAGSSVLQLGVTGVGAEGQQWEALSNITNDELIVESGRLAVSSTRQPGHNISPTQAVVEGGLNLNGADSSIAFHINGVMPANQDNATSTLLYVRDTLTLTNQTAVTLNFSNVNLSTQYYAGERFFLASADAIALANGELTTGFKQMIALGGGYYGSVYIESNYNASGRDYLVMSVVGDPRRTWSGMISGDYVWKDADDPKAVDAMWKENRTFDNGQLVLFGNLYQPEAWVDGSENELRSEQTVLVTGTQHMGNVVQPGEEGFAIDDVKDAAAGYQKVKIEGDVAPASIVIGANYTLNGVDTPDGTNYYFFGDGGSIREPDSDEVYNEFKDGSTSLRKMGAGTAVIATNNSFMGGTDLEGGRIVMQHENALGTGAVHIVNGAILQADFECNKADFAHLYAFTGEQMETTVVKNAVRTSVYVDPEKPDYDALVDARLSNAHDKKLVLTSLAGSDDTVVTFYGYSHESGQYSYAVFKVLNPTSFSGTVRMDGNIHGAKQADALGGNVQMEIMTTAKALDEDGGNWLNTTIDLTVENGTERTVLALDALGTSDADDTQIAQVNALHGTGKDGARINSSVLSMSHEKAITLQILGTVRGDYDGVLGYGDFQKTVDYGNGTPTDIGMVKHHYGRYGAEGVLNVLKEGNAIQSVNSAWLNVMDVQGGYFVVDEALVARSLNTADGTHLVVGTAGTSHSHALVVGKGGVLAIDSDPSVDALAGIGAGIPKHTEEVVTDAENDIIEIRDVAPSDFVLLTDGATIAGFGDWKTERTRWEMLNGVETPIEVGIDIATGATVTFNTHNYTPDASINAGNDVFFRYNSSHAIQLLGKMTGTNVHLVFNNENISAAALADKSASKREDGLGYTGKAGEQMGYVSIRDIHQFTGDITVKDMTVLQVRDANADAGSEASTADVSVTVQGANAAIQFTESASSQFMNEVSLTDGGRVLIGGELKETTNGITSVDMTGVDAVVTHWTDDSAYISNLKLENAGSRVRLGGTDETVAVATNASIASTDTTEAVELHDMKLRGSLVQLQQGCSLDVSDVVAIDADSRIIGSSSGVKARALAAAVEQGVDSLAAAIPAASEMVSVSADTTLELTTADERTVYTSSNQSQILHVYAEQLQNVEVSGTGLTLILADDIWSTAYHMGVEFLAIQVGGECGRFLFEENQSFADGIVGDDALFRLTDASGRQLSSCWVTSDYVAAQVGEAVSGYMLWVQVPEPSTSALGMLALGMLAARRRRK